MNQLKALFAGCVAVFMAAVFGLLVIAAMAGAQPAGAAAGSALSAVGGALKAGSVSAAYAAWIARAGSMCATASPALIAAQIQQESGFDPGAVSPAGAEGIAQFMPATWPSWGRNDDGTGNVSPFNPYDAIMAMGRYDCALAAQVAAVPGDPVANMLAAYNAGPGAVLQYRGVPPFPETQQYVASIQALIVKYLAPAPPGGAGGFAQREIQAAARYLGTAYVWGGGTYTGPSNGGSGTIQGFDCSGLVLYAVYQASGGAIALPHLADDQARLGAPVAPGGLKAGDVIAMKLGPASGPYDHIVIYAGGGQVITAPETGEVVRLQALASFGQVPMAIRRFG